MDLSLVVPTYNEKENIIRLIEEIQSEFKNNGIKGEIIIVDDGSPDETAKIVENLKIKNKNLVIIKRKGKLGLSSAVLEGWKNSKGKILGVMDADLSHPPKKIHELYNSIEKKGADFSIGTRYIKGGKIEGWNLKRKIMSRTATFLAKPFTKVKDPMSGFFMIKRECLDNVELNPKGFKILLEVILKANYKKLSEVPITFVDREKGKSKAGVSEISFYIRNLLGYWKYRRKVIDEFFKFAIVGILGTLVNLAVLYVFTEFIGMYYLFSASIAFLIAVINNYLLNKIWTFKENLKKSFVLKGGQFLIVSLIALGVNLFFLYLFTNIMGIYYMVSQVLAIGISLIINFLGNKLWTFKK